MEALLLFFDVGVLIAVYVWMIRHDGAEGPTTGLFRFKDRLPAKTEHHSTTSVQPSRGAGRPRMSR